MVSRKTAEKGKKRKSPQQRVKNFILESELTILRAQKIDENIKLMNKT
jgi:hypothetical protein